MQANTFVTGRYYKNECREIVILVTSRTKCFITYKELWISDLHNCYRDGKVKVRVNENNDEFVLIDGFSKYSSTDEYLKYVKEEVNVKEEEVKEEEVKEEVNVKEYYSAVHRNFIRVGKKFRYVDLKNDVIQDVVFEDTNDHGRVLNFRAINKDGSKFDCHGSLFVVTEHNRDCLKPFTFSTLEEVKETLEDSVLPLTTVAIANNVKEEEVKEVLEDSDLTLTNAIANNVKEEEVKETLEDSVLPLTTVAIANNVKEEEVKEEEGFKLTDDNKAVIQAIVKMDLARCNWSSLARTAYSKLEAWVSYPHDSRDIRGVYESSLMVLNTISKEDKARVKELVEKKEITLEDSNLPLHTNAIALVCKVTEVKILTKMVAVNLAVHHEVNLIHDPIFGWQLVGADSQLLREPLNEGGTQPTLKFKTREGATNFAVKLTAKVKELVEKKELTFKEVQKYAENAGYELTILTNEYCNFSVSSLSDRRGKFTKLIDVVEVIKEGRLLNGEFSSLPLPTKPTDNNAIATENNLEEEKEEDNMALTKESYEAVKILVKYDFKNLTQFEAMALNSLKKYIQNGVEPKLIKTFAEVLIKKLTPEERVQLRDLSLEKVFKGSRLDDVREYFRTGDNKAKENLKSYIRGVMSEEVFLNLCESEGIDNAHEASLKWLEFIDSMSVDCESSWEDSWQGFKESEGFKELKATS